MGIEPQMSQLQSSLRAVFEALTTNWGGGISSEMPNSSVIIPWRGDMGFVPHPRIGKGDFSSSVAIQLAAHTKLSAQEIAARFIPEISKQIPGEWYEDNGFLVVRGVANEWWSSEFRTRLLVQDLLGVSVGHNTVCVIPPGDELPTYAAVRLIALGAFQALAMVLAGAPCSLSLVGEAPCLVQSIDDVASSFGRALTAILNRKEPHKITDAALAMLPSEGSTFVWVAHHTSGSSRNGKREAFAALRRQPGVAIRMPNDGWLISRERAIPEILAEPYLRETLGSLSGTDALLRGVVHAASSTPSALYDPAVAHFDELTSLWYALGELRSRLKTLVPEIYRQLEGERLALAQRELLQGDGESDSRSDFEKLLWYSAMRVPYRLVALGTAGEVGEAVLACEEFCELSHRYLNGPALRRCVHKGELSAKQRKILAGISLGLSSILGKVYEL